jgi:hypothetical protein
MLFISREHIKWNPKAPSLGLQDHSLLIDFKESTHSNTFPIPVEEESSQKLWPLPANLSWINSRQHVEILPNFHPQLWTLAEMEK